MHHTKIAVGLVEHAARTWVVKDNVRAMIINGNFLDAGYDGTAPCSQTRKVGLHEVSTGPLRHQCGSPGSSHRQHSIALQYTGEDWGKNRAMYETTPGQRG